MAIELTTADPATINSIRSYLSAVGLVGNETVYGTKTFSNSLSSQALSAIKTFTEDSFTYNNSKVMNLTASELKVLNDMTVSGAISSSIHGNSFLWNEAYLKTNDSAIVDRTKLSITRIGEYLFPPIYQITPEQYFAIGDEDLDLSGGKSLELLNYRETSNFENGLVYISFNDLDYITSSLNFTIVPKLNTLSLTGLKGVGGGIQISSLNSLTAFNVENLKSVGAQITIASSSISEINFPSLVGVGSFISFSSNPNLSQINLPNLEFCNGSFNVSVNSVMTSLNLPKLKNLGSSFSITNSNLFDISAPELVVCGGSVSFNNLTNVKTINVNKLEEISSNISLFNVPNLNRLEFPSLKFLGNLNFGGGITSDQSNYKGLTSIHFPSIERDFGLFSINNVNTLSTIEFPTVGIWKQLSNNVQLFNLPLTTETIDNLMNHIAYMDGNNGTTLYGSGRTITIIPSGMAPSNLGVVFTDGSNFVCNGTVCTVNLTNHGYSSGDVLQVSNVGVALSANRYAVINVSSPDIFTYNIDAMAPVNTFGTGTARIVKANDSVKAIVTRGVTLITN